MNLKGLKTFCCWENCLGSKQWNPESVRPLERTPARQGDLNYPPLWWQGEAGEAGNGYIRPNWRKQYFWSGAPNNGPNSTFLPAIGNDTWNAKLRAVQQGWLQVDRGGGLPTGVVSHVQPISSCLSFTLGTSCLLFKALSQVCGNIN